MTELVVAVTLGQRDLQVLAVSDGQVFSFSPDSRQTRAFHQWLLDDPKSCDIVAPDQTACEIIEQQRFDMKEGKISLPGNGRFVLATNADIGRAGPDEGKVLVYPKLLSESLRVLKRELSDGSICLRQVLVLYTQRDADSRWAAGEPIAAKRFADWLEGWLAVDSGTVLVVPFLRGREEVTRKDQAGNQHLLPEAAGRIDRAIRDAASLAETGEATIRLHDSGGIPQSSPVLQAAARLHFGIRVQYKAPVERADSPVVSPAPGILFSPVAVLEARRRACDLVQRGEFQAAAELAREFLTDGASWNWTRCLAAAARYFQGYLEDARRQTGTLNDCPTRQALERILAPGWPMSLHVALRTEAALAAEDVLNAASLTRTFLDVAEYDVINRTLSRDQQQPCMDRATRQITWKLLDLTRDQLRQSVNDLPNVADWIRMPMQHYVDSWLQGPTMGTTYVWQKYAMFCVIGSNREHAGLAQALTNLLDALYRRTNTGNIPAQFRNIQMHSVVTDQEIRLMIQLFESESRLLWWRRSGGSRSCLHPETRVAAALAALGVADGQSLYGNLVQALVSDLRSCDLGENR